MALQVLTAREARALFRHLAGGQQWVFPDLADLMAKASPPRSGDMLAGLGAESATQRVAARMALADLPLARFLSDALVPYEEDEVTRLIIDTHDERVFRPISHLTVGGFRDWLLASGTTGAQLRAIARGVTPEMAAAVSKLMRNQDLILVARKCQVVTRFRNTIGLPGTLAVRLQPNHPSDNLAGVAASCLDGLFCGAGDAVIGVNPASDNLAVIGDLLRLLDDLIGRYEIPTQSCVLTPVTSTLELIGRGAPVDLVFQSVAGTQAANRSFGIDLALLAEARDAALGLGRGTVGDNVMYFETGQGSALSAHAHHGLDQQTCEARAYAVCRAFDPLLVNTVVGFIGPEYLYDGKQIIRAVLVLIGERPGLSSPDSLGAYLTLNRAGAKTDADRNCVSNIRPEGLSPQQAAGKVARLLAAAFQGGMTGVSLKDEDEPLLSSPNEAERGTILLTP